MSKITLNMYIIPCFLLFLLSLHFINVSTFALAHAGDVVCVRKNSTMHAHDVGRLLYGDVMNLIRPIIARVNGLAN